MLLRKSVSDIPRLLHSTELMVFRVFVLPCGKISSQMDSQLRQEMKIPNFIKQMNEMERPAKIHSIKCIILLYLCSKHCCHCLDTAKFGHSKQYILSFTLYKNNYDDGTNCQSSKPSVNIIQLDFNSSTLKRDTWRPACHLCPVVFVGFQLEMPQSCDS
jgi:hypothetical protein